MAGPTSVAQIDLMPERGRTYFNTNREWREEFIYFLMVDRFHDDVHRTPSLRAERSQGVRVPGGFYGGKIKGVTRNLNYIAGLGCTSIWLSPIFTANSYHGYDIRNYLDVDPRFGTKQDLIDLVRAAHARTPPMRIILDVVINHSGDNWEYAGGAKLYDNDTRFEFGGFRQGLEPVPVELRDPDLYHRRGKIHDDKFDSYPENQHGDLFGLKDYANDDDAAGSRVLDILIKCHCYWIRETDVDGFRVDAVKHMGELACSRFCSMIREYAYSIGKRGFFLFGEAAAPDDDLYDRYIGPNTSRHEGGQTVFFGINSLLDFRLAQGAGPGRDPLRDVIKGFVGPGTLFQRLEAQRNRALNRGELGRYLVTFLDNHDGFWQEDRFAWQAPDEQVIAGVGYLLCALGTSCIYYGTEQGFEGHGGDEQKREAMFDKSQPGRNLLNTGCTIYKEIAKIAAVVRAREALRFGRMYFRNISGDGEHFGEPFGTTYTLAFSRVLYGREVLVAYNVSAQPRSDCVVVDASLHKPGDVMKYLYGKSGGARVERAANGTHFVRLEMPGRKFVILE